jgi:hypothetical protein
MVFIMSPPTLHYPFKLILFNLQFNKNNFFWIPRSPWGVGVGQNQLPTMYQQPATNQTIPVMNWSLLVRLLVAIQIEITGSPASCCSNFGYIFWIGIRGKLNYFSLFCVLRQQLFGQKIKLT